MKASAEGRDERVALDWRTRTLIRVGVWVMRALRLTWRYRVYGRDALVARQPGDQRVVYAFWHGQILPCFLAHTQRAGVLISEHRDGEIIARVIGHFDMYGIRGSTSRGGTRALLECVRTLREGTDVAVTPDGPRGPRHTFAPGALLIAYRAAAPLVTIVAHIDRAWRLKSWDGFEIPKPFARITIVYGEPRRIEGEDVRAVSERTGEFAALMDAEHARAAMLAQQG